MPAAVFGLPLPARGWSANVNALVTSGSTVANTEYLVPNSSFSLVGRTLMGFVAVRASESKSGQVKSTTYRLYRDGAMIASGTLGDTGDHTDGNQHTMTLYVPAQAGGAHNYYVTWAFNLTATAPDGLYSLWRQVSVLPDFG